MTPLRRRAGAVIVLALVLGMTAPVAASDDARRDLPPNFVAQRIGGPIVNFVLPPGGTSGPTSVTSPVRAFRFKGQGTIAVSGVPGAGTIAFTATGELLGTNRIHVLVTASGAGIATPQSAEVSLVGNDLYFRTLTPNTTGAGQWVKVDGGTTGLMTTTGSGTQDLLDGTGLLSGGNGTQILPDDTVNGTLVTHVRITADPRATSDALAGTGITMPLTAIDAYVGKSDTKLHRLTLTNSTQFDLGMLSDLLGPSATASTAAISGTATAMVNFSIDFTDFNDTTIAVAAPTNAISLSQFGASAGGFPAANGNTVATPPARPILPPSGVPAVPVTPFRP